MKKPNIADLSLREKIAQTAISYPAADLCDPDHPFGTTWNVGGLRMAFVNMDFLSNDDNRKTVAEYREDIAHINSVHKVPILSAMDCNYGINGAFYEMSPIVSAPVIGAANDEELAYETGRLRGLNLRKASSNWWWGPEIDLVARNSEISFGRLYSDDPERQGRLALAEMRGCQAVGVAATAKHFPGADGMEYRDPHTSFQMLHISYEEWAEKQGKLFQMMIDQGVDTVMISHMAFPAYDNTKVNGRYLPSSASYKVITELLKGEMHFDGVVVTDAVKMLGLYTIFGNLPQVYIACLKAGNDAILGVDIDYIDVIEDAVKRGEIPEARIDDACSRVLALKEKLGLFENATPVDIPESVEELNRQVKRVNQAIASKAITLVANRRKLFPLNPAEIKRVHIVTLSSDPGFAGQLKAGLGAALERRGIQVGVSSNLYSYEEMERIADNNDLILYACCRFRKNVYFDRDNRESFNFVLHNGREKSVGISFGDPYVYFDALSIFDTFINAYSVTEETQEAVAAAILGEINFQKNSPFEIIPAAFREYEALE